MAAEPPRVVDSENLAGLINTVMLRNQLQPRDIRGDRKCQDVNGRGEFYCTLCGEAWVAYFSWVRIDLFDQRIVYRWSMKCRSCHTPHTPVFAIPEVEKLIEKAVCGYKGVPFRARNRRRFMHFQEPHQSLLCEKCDWGRTQCWRAFYQNQ